MMKNKGGTDKRKTLIISSLFLPSLPISNPLGIIVTIAEILPRATTSPISTLEALRLLKYKGKRV
jgi:hypothetical protein